MLLPSACKEGQASLCCEDKGRAGVGARQSGVGGAIREEDPDGHRLRLGRGDDRSVILTTKGKTLDYSVMSGILYLYEISLCRVAIFCAWPEVTSFQAVGPPRLFR